MKKTTQSKQKKPTLKSLFPNGEEKYLSVLVRLYDQDIVHIVICNDALAENKTVWKKTAEIIKDTDLELTLGTINKEDFRVLKAADNLNSQGDESIACVESQAEYLKLMKDLIKDYNSTLDLIADLNLQDEQVNNLLGNGLEQVGNTGIGTYTPQSDEEIEFMYGR